MIIYILYNIIGVHLSVAWISAPHIICILLYKFQKEKSESCNLLT